MKNQMIRLLFLSLLLSSSGCGVDLKKSDLIFSAPKSPTTEEIKVDPIQTDAQFLAIQKNLFEVSCLKCHGPNQTRRSNLASKEMLIDNYDEILYRMTDAFEEDNRPMPPIGKGKRVSAELILEFQKWKDSL